MAAVSNCPDLDRLERLVLGRLPCAEAETLEEHLAHCVRCAERVSGVKGADTLVDDLRSAATPPPDEADQEIVEELIRRLKTLPAPSAVSAPGAATLAESAAATPASDAAAEASPEITKELYTFLSPSTAPGELGGLGPYRILKVLGAGGMGVVFLAEDPYLQRTFALKAMKPALAASPSARERFLREARATAKIRHDHIVTIYQVGEDRGVPFLAMELLEGETLEACLRREGKLPLSEVLRIGRQVAEGLAAAHKRGLIHRDIKPANVWLEAETGRVKLLDFGLAKATEGDANITQSGAIVGTPAYMAPEQARGETVDARSDLFSLGCVLYRMATGRPAFSGANTTAALLSVSTDQPPPPADLNPELPEALSHLIMRLLAKDPGQRPDSARAVIEGLSEPRPSGSGTDPGAAVKPLPDGRGSDRAPRRRWLVAAAVMLAVLGPLTWFFGGTVIRIATNQGELVIETDGANIEVIVRADGVRIGDLTTKRRFNLKAGPEHEIEVYELPQGIKLFTKRFTLTRGGREIVNVRHELARLDKETTDPDRRAADWILARGGTMEVRADGEQRQVSRCADLPETPFRITTIRFGNATNLDDQALKELGLFRLLGLQGLTFEDVDNITDKGLLDLNLSSLRLLNISFFGTAKPKITNKSIQFFIAAREMRALHLRGVAVSDEGLAAIAQNLKKLESFSGCGVTDKGVQFLEALPSLRSLHLLETSVSGKAVARLRALRTLTFEFAKVRDNDLLALESMEQLENLNLRKTSVTAVGVAALQKALPNCRVEWDGSGK